MACLDWELLSRYQDASLEALENGRISAHLMVCTSCQEKLRSLGDAGLFFRIALSSQRDKECPPAEQLGAYLSGSLAAPDRRRLETHLVSCSVCLHEVAVLGDEGAFEPTVDSPMPEERALGWFASLAPAPVERRLGLRRAGTWGLRVAAALLPLVLIFGQATQSPEVPGVTAVASADTTGSHVLTEVGLNSGEMLLEEESADLTQFAREAGFIFRQVQHVAERPRVQSFELVKEDILRSGILEDVVRLKESTSDLREQQLLRNCEYLLTQIAKVEPTNMDRSLRTLASEIRRLNLIENARLVEMESDGTQWLAGL